MFKSNKNHTEFNVQGTIQNIWMKNGKLKLITLLTPLGLLLIKISKEARMVGVSSFTPGYEVRVTGYKKQDFKTGAIKLKANRVIPVSQPRSHLINSSIHTEDQVSSTRDLGITVEPLQQSVITPATPCTEPSAKILICQKSDCRKRGGDAVCTILQQELAQRGLEDQVTIQKTGCLKKCKSGPNLVVLPHKTRYSKVEPEEIPTLVAQHF